LLLREKEMVEEVIKTGVDELLDILKHSSKLPLSDVAKKLNVSMDVAQAWVDFLVEEGIVGIEYKFTTPFVYLNKALEEEAAPEQPSLENEMKINLALFKKQFWDKAQKNSIPESKVQMLWRNHLMQELEIKKKFFFFEAQRRKIHDVDNLWSEYQNNLLSI
jgi:hypothetical protein